MENKKMKTLREMNKAMGESNKKPDGYVYAYVDGKKEFYPLEKVTIKMRDKDISVGDLVKLVEQLELKVKLLSEKIEQTLDDISAYSIMD